MLKQNRMNANEFSTTLPFMLYFIWGTSKSRLAGCGYDVITTTTKYKPEKKFEHQLFSC